MGWDNFSIKYIASHVKHLFIDKILHLQNALQMICKCEQVLWFFIMCQNVPDFNEQ